MSSFELVDAFNNEKKRKERIHGIHASEIVGSHWQLGR